MEGDFLSKRKSILESITDGFKALRVKPNIGKEAEVPVARKGHSITDELEELEGSGLIDLSQIDELKTIATDRDTLYQVFDEMKKDTTISSALEMYADDATQYSKDGKIIWADSEDPDVAAFANRIINVTHLNENAWSHINSLVTYGDIYLETFTDDKDDSDYTKQDCTIGNVSIKKRKKGYKLEEYIELYSNPAEIFDLVEHGKTVGFVKSPVKEQSGSNTFQYAYTINVTDNTENTLLDSRKFIHISIGTGTDRFPETVSVSYTHETECLDDEQIRKEETVQKIYKVKKGESIMQDVYTTYQIISLMEDSLLLNRVTRSSIIRLLQIEVGDMSKNQVSTTLKRLKNMVEQRNMMDKGTGKFKSQASPGPIDNILYIPTRNGKGNITAQNLGGDVDVRSIADLDYFSNKLYAGLKIPKSYLGQDIEGGLSAGSSLTKLDARYARTIKRIQNAYIQGITTLINLFALDKGLDDYVNKFTVKMVSPSTTEEQERDETLGTKVSLASDILGLIDTYYPDNNDMSREVLKYFTSMYFSDSKLTSIIESNEEKESIDDEESNKESDLDNFDISDSEPDNHDSILSRGNVGHNDFNNFDVEPKSFNNTPIANSLSEPELPESGEESGFGDFEKFY